MTSPTTDRRQGVNSSAAIKVPCRVATTANITLSGAQTIDGIAVVADDRVLVKDQTDQTENGIYVCDSGTWERSLDFAGVNYDIKKGTLVLVLSGTAGGPAFYRQATADPIVVGTSLITFTISNTTLAGVTAYMVTVLAAATAAAARTVLGVGSGDSPTFAGMALTGTISGTPTFSGAVTMSAGLTLSGTLTSNGNSALGDNVADTHSILGSVNITDDGTGLTLVRAGGGDQMHLVASAAASGGTIAIFNAGQTDYYNLALNALALVINTRTSVGVVTEAARVEATGSLQLGGTAARAGTAGTKRIDIFNGTAPTSTLANGISFYATAGEAFVMDAAGTATLLSSHDDANDWIHQSIKPDGREVYYRMEAMADFLQEKYGTEFMDKFGVPFAEKIQRELVDVEVTETAGPQPARQKTQKVTREVVVIENVDGKFIRTTKETEVVEPVFNLHPLFHPDGSPVMVLLADGETLVQQVFREPVMEEAHTPDPITKTVQAWERPK